MELLERRRRDEALHDASERGHEAIVSQLLRAGAVEDARDVDKRTPLHLACINGHAAVVTLLMEGGADIDVFDKQVRTPLHLASMGGHAVWPARRDTPMSCPCCSRVERRLTNWVERHWTTMETDWVTCCARRCTWPAWRGMLLW